MKRVCETLLISSVIVSAGCAYDFPVVSNAGIPIDTTSEQVLGIKELREQFIEMQKEDYSCGAASLATLMKYYFNENISELTVLNTVKSMFTEKEYNIIASNGLSLLELGQVSEALGFQSAAVRLTTAALKKLKGPVLIYVETSEYKHFAVFRAIHNGYAYLADPSRGNVKLPMQTFLEEWKGQALVLGKKGFGIPEQHKLAVTRTLPFDEDTIFRQFDHKLAPTQSELLGGTYAR